MALPSPPPDQAAPPGNARGWEVPGGLSFGAGRCLSPGRTRDFSLAAGQKLARNLVTAFQYSLFSILRGIFLVGLGLRLTFLVILKISTYFSWLYKSEPQRTLGVYYISPGFKPINMPEKSS